MRKQLIENNQKMWDMMEEQKRLNAAFAHDLRTPLTVLRGYTDLLNQYVPEGKISEDKLISTLSMISGHVDRLENYCNTMKEIYSIEELPVKKQPVDIIELENKFREFIEIMNGKNGIHIKFMNSVFDQPEEIFLDLLIVMEVFENLMSNALRYARKEIEVILSVSEDGEKLVLSVADDGKGFTKNDLIMAVKPYYTDNKEYKSGHFGIGLYICRILCEKHRGHLTLENRLQSGAVVTAVFTLM
jgi:signal transduction histidine kinase